MYAVYPIFLMVILVFSLIAPDCWCVRVYMSSFLGLRSASVASLNSSDNQNHR